MIAGIIVEYQDFLALWIFEILASVDISLVIGTDKITRSGVLINTTYLKSTPYHLQAIDAAHTHYKHRGVDEGSGCGQYRMRDGVPGLRIE